MKIIKPLIPVLLCVALAVVVFPSAIHATDTNAVPSTNVYIAAEQTTAYVGDTITVTFSCNEVSLHTLTGGIRFNTEYLTCTSATLAEANGHGLLTDNLTPAEGEKFRMVGLSTVEEANEAGQIGFYSIGTVNQDFAGTLLFTATFEVLKAGEIDLIAYEDSYEGTNTEEVQTLTVTATERPQSISVVSKGVSEYSSTTDVGYSVNGQVVTVKYATACKVGYWSETDGKYIALTAVANDDDSYSFTAPEGVTEVLLVVKGDTNLNGSIANIDVTQAKLAYQGKKTLSNEAIFAADVTGDGIVKNQDATQIKLVYLQKKTLTW